MNTLENIRSQKRAFRAYRKLAKQLPEEYRIVFHEMEAYVWNFSLDGSVEMLSDLVLLFQAGAAEGKPVLEITGEDVAGFCDELLREWLSRTWQEQVREKFNKRIHDRLSSLGKKHAKQE